MATKTGRGEVLPTAPAITTVSLAASQSDALDKSGQVVIVTLAIGRPLLPRPCRWSPSRLSETTAPSGRCRRVSGREGPRRYAAILREAKRLLAMPNRGVV